MRSSTAAGVPISATMVAPHKSRPGSNTCPGFLRVNVTVQSAAAAPRDSPVSPSRPLGTSMAMTGRPRSATAASVVATSAPSGRVNPEPNSASTTRWAPSSTAGPSASTVPLQFAAWYAASPRRRSRGAREATRTFQPDAANTFAATNPSPPLLPGPHRTTVGRADQRRIASRATAVPALRIRSTPGVPAATVKRSASCICATRSRAVGDAAVSELNASLRACCRRRRAGR